MPLIAGFSRPDRHFSLALGELTGNFKRLLRFCLGMVQKNSYHPRVRSRDCVTHAHSFIQGPPTRRLDIYNVDVSAITRPSDCNMTRADSITANSRRKRFIVDVVSRRYDLGSWRRTERLTGGVLNEVYLAETSRGHFVIRVNRVRRSITEIERLSTFLSHLRNRGIPADELVPAADGRVAAEMDGELLSVHRFIQGTVYASPAELSESQTANLMRFLAYYHSAAGEYRTGGRLAARDEMLPVMYTDDPDRLRGRLKRLPKMAKVEASAVNRAIDRLGSFFASGAYRELKRTWVHGDYRLCNVAFDADRVSGLFDWDLLCDGPRLFDVVVASADLARTNAGPMSQGLPMCGRGTSGVISRPTGRKRGDAGRT